MTEKPTAAAWPDLPYAAWKDTCQTLHLWTQIVGKIRLARTPWLNHSWHVTLYVSARGLTTSPIPDGERTFQIDFDFIDHVLRVRTSDGQERELALVPMPVADFYAELFRALSRLGIDVRINETPSEIADAIRFSEDRVHASYDRDDANRFWRVLVRSHEVFSRFPHRVSRQGEPGAFLLGQLRSRGDALFRTARAAPSRRRAEPARYGGAGGLFTRGEQRGLLAGRRRQSTIRPTIPTPIRPQKDLRRRASAPRTRSTARSSANSSCPTTRCARRRIRRGR